MKKTKWIISATALGLLLVYGLKAWSEIGDYPEKLWLHRCNSLEKMEEKEKVYDNVEVDLVYRGNGVFDVTHDADVSFGLKLDPYFAEIAKDDGHLWLDIKNVNLANCKEMDEDLDSLCQAYKVDKDQLIIEGGNVDALNFFTQDDYYTSYYVPFDKPSRLTDQEIEACVDSLRVIADSKKVKALSFPGWWYKDIKQTLHRPIDLLTWKHRTTQWEFFIQPIHYQMMKDNQLKVILIKSKGKYHR